MRARARFARFVTLVVNGGVRLLRRRGGTVLGGRVGLALDPSLLEELAAGRRVALVTGTNGKTTTTRLLAAALGTEVATNLTGSNMPAGIVAALASSKPGLDAVLEVDEAYMPMLVAQLGPSVVVCLNLSRDQLDRTSEVRMTAAKWGRGFEDSEAIVVANADDPLVVDAARHAKSTRWVGAGLSWRLDAVGCPACEGSIVWDDRGRWSSECGLSRPDPVAWLGDGGNVQFADGADHRLEMGVPGRFNAANGLMAIVAAEVLGVDREVAIERVAHVEEVAGRFASCAVGGVEVRLMLAKNPAGWQELLELLEDAQKPVVVAINARIADGKDPSWLWDVPFERLRGRRVVAAGERCLDLAVRLRYAEVDHETEATLMKAIPLAGEDVDFIGNYTPFAELAGL